MILQQIVWHTPLNILQIAMESRLARPNPRVPTFFCFIQLTYSTKIEQEDRRIIVFIYNVPSTLGESRDTPAYHR